MKGATFVELLVAMTIVLILAAGVAGVMRRVSVEATTQPLAADLVQRLRAMRWGLESELLQAGSGPTRVPGAGPLARWIPAVYPRRLGTDPDTQAFSDRFTLLMVLDDSREAPLAPMPVPSGPLIPLAGPWCEPSAPACGFLSDRTLLVFDERSRFDVVPAVTVGPAGLQPAAELVAPFDTNAHLTEARVVSYRFDAVRRQVRRTLASGREQPGIDEVVGFAVEYFGDPFPPLVPRPPLGVATCVAEADGTARLPVLAPTHGTLAALDLRSLADGPWCGEPPLRFDADLYRVRRVRLRVRLQTDAAAQRGRDRHRFARPGTASDPAAEVPDIEVVLDVAPPNLLWPGGGS